MIEFKDDELREQWRSGKLEPVLAFITHAVASKLLEAFNVRMVITSLFRKGDGGVHGVWRGVDIRTRYLTDEQAAELALWINSIVIYDKMRPDLMVAVWGDANHRNHIHLQVHPNTVFNMKG